MIRCQLCSGLYNFGSDAHGIVTMRLSAHAALIELCKMDLNRPNVDGNKELEANSEKNMLGFASTA